MHSSSSHFSQAVERIDPALSIVINQMVYNLRRLGRDVITLSLGEAFFDLPLFDFKSLDFTRGFHYSDTQGLPELREKIADFYGSQYGAPVDATSEVLITAGSKAAIFMSMVVVLDPGDEVLIHEPAWLSYKDQARMLHADVRFIPFDAAPADFSDHFGPRTRMLILCNPNNPAGRLYSEDDLAHIYELCRKNGAHLLVDEAYSDFVLENAFPSLARIAPDKEGLIVTNSLSKNMGMSGWRIGYVIGSAPFVQRLLKVNQHVITCAPTILQLYLIQYFDEIIEITLPQVQEVVEKRRRVSETIDELGLVRLGGESTFYFFVGIGDFPSDSYDFAIHLLREHAVAVVPGLAYGASTDRFIRVSIGTESEERIHEALVSIHSLTRANALSSQQLEQLRRETEATAV